MTLIYTNKMYSTQLAPGSKSVTTKWKKSFLWTLNCNFLGSLMLCVLFWWQVVSNLAHFYHMLVQFWLIFDTSGSICNFFWKNYEIRAKIDKKRRFHFIFSNVFFQKNWKNMESTKFFFQCNSLTTIQSRSGLLELTD